MLEKNLPRLEELRETGKVFHEDPAIPAIAVFALLLNLSSREESRERIISAFFALLDKLRPDITPEMISKIEVYIRAINRDGVELFSKKRT